MQQHGTLRTVIDLKQLTAIVPYSGQHISRLEAVGKFPKRLSLGANRVGWLLTEVEAWVSAKADARNAKPDITAGEVK